MSGQAESKAVDERLKEAESILNEYDSRFLVNKLIVNPEVDNILEMKQNELRALSREDCFNYAFILAQFAAALQKEHNRQYAKLKWANHNLDIVVGSEYANYGDKFTKYEVKKILIIEDNIYAKTLNKIILDAITKLEEFNFISTRISNMSDILKEYGKGKKE